MILPTGLTIERKHMYLEMAYTHDLEAAENFKKEVQEAFPGMEIRMDPLSLAFPAISDRER